MPIKNLKNKWRRALAVLAVTISCSVFFPQMLFGDCIRAVVPEKQENCLTEEDYVSLFEIEKSNYKIKWKFLQND
ncbi:hypothetical protein BRYFOR_05837 [Marvinbryantia formatexigens DSM 14469]|uniref:Uncharacterized protein n=1 Tax=Marvinbryantia formatexigens DSM 14469 TaxID=478749 RepID=C6LB42_9FIRM|nr:hypothetical protein [Marvinbryantia formatexigens]EET62173.1 hypothetical protein BRYFOR_05837 [Marvinbryantia formatexigens DSM 14469]UWO26489.1 hypothetical protein NQ534_08545 [Marvinbryantia formatexigens DSM 14469]SDF78780.1 hypothetical protein SAMN05660368_01314 [Marvinbryantia formatexigens]